LAELANGELDSDADIRRSRPVADYICFFARPLRFLSRILHVALILRIFLRDLTPFLLRAVLAAMIVIFDELEADSMNEMAQAICEKCEMIRKYLVGAGNTRELPMIFELMSRRVCVCETTTAGRNFLDFAIYCIHRVAVAVFPVIGHYLLSIMGCPTITPEDKTSVNDIARHLVT
jgi:hypothetical protein